MRGDLEPDRKNVKKSIEEQISAGDLVRIEEQSAEIDAEIKKYIDAHEKVGIIFNDQMKKEVRQKFYTVSSDPNNSMIVGAPGTTVNDILRQTTVINSKESFEAGKASVATPSM